MLQAAEASPVSSMSNVKEECCQAAVQLPGPQASNGLARKHTAELQQPY